MSSCGIIMIKLQAKVFLLILLIPLLTGCDSSVERIAFDQKACPYVAFENVNLVPMTTEKVVTGQTILVKGNLIFAVGDEADVKIPNNTCIIDGSGKYLMPGLADMHVHTTDAWQSMEWPVSPLDLFLANGVTTIRDFGPKGTITDYTLHWRDAIAASQLDGPTIYTSGGILYGPLDHPGQEVLDQQARGFDFIKLYSFLSRDEFNEAISTARKQGIYTAGHIPFQVGLDAVLEAGMDEIAHVEELAWELVEFDRNKDLVGYPWLRYVAETGYMQFKKEFNLDPQKLGPQFRQEISALAKKLQVTRTPVCSTLVVDDVIRKKLFHVSEFQDDPTSAFLPPKYLKRLQRGQEKHQVMFKGGEDYAPFKYEVDKHLLRELKKQGVPVLLSTDAGGGGMGIVPGFSIHRELEILVENGFSPYEAIAAGTVKASQVAAKMSGRDEFGTIQVDKRADLLLLDANPLLDVSHIRKPLGVMAAGRWFDQRMLQGKLKPGIPLTAVVRHIREPDHQSQTHFEILVGHDFKGKLPGAVAEISIVGPRGKLALGKEDFRYFSSVRAFWAQLPGSPQVGTYVFSLASHDRKGVATNTQSIVRNIGVPDTAALSPVSGALIDTATVTFSWGGLETSFPVYYRLEVLDQDGVRVYSTTYIKDMLSHTVPESVLKPGKLYRWRVRVVDQPNWFSVQNRSQCLLQRFSMAMELR